MRIGNSWLVIEARWIAAIVVLCFTISIAPPSQERLVLPLAHDRLAKSPAPLSSEQAAMLR